MIELKNVSLLANGKAILDKANAKFPSGATYAIICKNDDLQSIVDVITGVTMPDSGFVKVDGFSYEKQTKKSYLGMSYVPFKAVVCLDMTVKETLLMAADLHRMDYEKAIWQLNEILNWVGLSEKGKTLVKDLSKVEKYLLQVGMACMGKSNTIIVDDFACDFKEEIAKAIMEVYRNIALKKTLIFLTSQWQASLVGFCDCILNVNENGSFDDISENAKQMLNEEKQVQEDKEKNGDGNL